MELLDEEVRSKRRRWALIAAAAGALALGALYYGGRLGFNHPSLSRYPVRGIDVSHHQGPIDWDAVASDGVTFAYIKASEGGDYQDRRFKENWLGARHAGVLAGAYHFFTFCKDGAAQAENF